MGQQAKIFHQTKYHTLLQGRVKTVLQVAWLLLVAWMLVSFTIGVPIRYRSLLKLVDDGEPSIIPGLSPALEAVGTSRLNQPEATALQDLGISLKFYAGYILFFDLALAVMGILIGILIFWRKPNDWMALWVSLILILLGTNGASLVVPSISLVLPGWVLVTYLFGFLGMVSNVHMLFNLPDGRYVPGWTRTLAQGFTWLMVAAAAFAAIDFMYLRMLNSTIVLLSVTPLWLGLSFVGIATQVYRYLRVSDQIQRQQAKWVAFGLIPVTLGFSINGIILFASSVESNVSQVFLNMLRAPLVNLCFAFFPVCLAISVLRYRLWDIDLIIRRTLQYALLTGMLSLLYFGVVTLLQSFLTAVGRQPSTVVIVLTTLLIAALFNPLRRRIQAFIDRRFYRQKYNAELALAKFAQIAREETDLEYISERLIGTVRETLQPEKINLLLVNITDRPK